ncbi:MAG: transglycosylase SLT domain-containing protein [Treponema sp.]|nr:transglycosylase SLT domain-containing protein [Treponema sp.]
MRKTPTFLLFIFLSTSTAQMWSEDLISVQTNDNISEILEEEIPLEELSFIEDDIFTDEVDTQKIDVQNIANDETDLSATNMQNEKQRLTVDFWVDDRSDIQKFSQTYLSSKWSSLLKKDLDTAINYRLYVRKKIQEQHLPSILEYLPVVESNYKTTAKSSSGALGMWQFMSNSVKPFLMLNDYVDERLDPWKSTDAALKKLTDNYNYFQDWLLAIAAYNCGTGALIKILQKSPQKDYWYLVDNNLLPKQTALYIPKLIAIADIAENAEFYNIDISHRDEEFSTLINNENQFFDSVTVSKAYSIPQLAREMQIKSEELKKLNPSFVKNFTHPSIKSEIRIPIGQKETAEKALAKMEPIDFPFKYKVEKGDTLWGISRQFKVTVASLCELNGIEEKAILSIGKILYIPSK